jgi:hypothetical protein
MKPFRLTLARSSAVLLVLVLTSTPVAAQKAVGTTGTLISASGPVPSPMVESVTDPTDPTDPALAAAPVDVARSLRVQAQELVRLAAEIASQRVVIAGQQQTIQGLQQQVTAVSAAKAAAADQPSPLTIHLGDAELLPGGFMDATAVYRSTNHGTGLPTSFGTIPFENTAQGGLSETRFSAQNSRITLQATSKIGQAAMKGYIEADFLGNAPATLNVTSNSNTLRMRLYWMQFTQGRFEFLGGQSWSLLTPNRNGVSPAPGDLFFSQDVDTNYQMGLVWSRVTQFRFVTHPASSLSAAVSLENPQQYVGTAVALPASFPATEVDVNGNTAAPNRYPDVIGKVAFDPKTGATHQHLEAAVVVRGYKTYTPSNDGSFASTGVGVSVNGVAEPVRNVRLVATTFFSNGGGRYIGNTNLPDFIVNTDGSPQLVKARSLLLGTELQVTKKTLVYGYGSAAQADAALAVDVNGKAIGFGIPGSTSANKLITEATIGVTHTFYRDPKVGGVQLMVQYSRLQRTPFAPLTGPSDARTNMVYVNVRYLLP